MKRSLAELEVVRTSHPMCAMTCVAAHGSAMIMADRTKKSMFLSVVRNFGKDPPSRACEIAPVFGAFSADGSWCACAIGNEIILVPTFPARTFAKRFANDDPTFFLDGAPADVSTLAVLNDGTVVVGTKCGRLQFWAEDDDEPRKVLGPLAKKHVAPITRIVELKDGLLVFTDTIMTIIPFSAS